MMAPRARRVDGNQAVIVGALRAAGCFVDDTSRLGDGFPDLVVGTREGLIYTVEVKLPSGQLTDKEVAYIVKRVMPGHRIFFDAQQAVDAITKSLLD